MKTRNIQHLLIATLVSAALFSCKKSSSSDTTTTPSNAQLQTQSDDQTQVSSETDAAYDDVNTSMTSQAGVTGSSEVAPIRYGVATQGNQDTVTTGICDAVVTVDTVDATRTITINYNGGANCSMTRSRTGTVVISWAKGMVWRNKGAVVTVTFTNLKITRHSDGKSIVINGTHTYTNVSGGSLASLNSNNAGPIIHTITSSNMSITFDSGGVRTWNVARQRSFSYNGGLVITTTGLQTQNGVTGVSEWGVNRYGNDFTLQIVNPVVIAQSCSWYVTSGEMALTNAAGTTDLTFGLNAQGAALTSCPIGTGASFYAQLSWTGKAGKTYTYIFPY